MQSKVTKEKLRQFMEELAAAAQSPGNVYLTGGATALLLGFREQTIDIDIKFDPEPAGVFEAIARLKEELEVNVELASPADFIPAPGNWREKSPHIATVGRLQFFHYDLAMQALAKIERGHAQDLSDTRNLLRCGRITVDELKALFSRIEGALIRYPAIDAGEFKRKLESFLSSER